MQDGIKEGKMVDEVQENEEISYLYRLVSPEIYSEKEQALARKFLIKGFAAARELGYRKPLKDRTELRENIAKRVSKSVEQREWGCLIRKVQLDYLEIADQVLALIPDELHKEKAPFSVGFVDEH